MTLKSISLIGNTIRIITIITIGMETDSIIIIVIAEVIIISKVPLNHVTVPDHMPTLVSQSHISFTRNRIIIPGIIY